MISFDSSWKLQRTHASASVKIFTWVTTLHSLIVGKVASCSINNVLLPMPSFFVRLHERLQECHGDEVLKAEAGAKVQKFTEWALKCIGVHSRCQENKSRRSHSTILEVQLQLSAFKNFLDLAGNNLTGKDFTEAFDAACFPLTLFSTSGISATVIQGLLGMLVEGGADNVNQCFLEASRFGSTELVRILLQVFIYFQFHGADNNFRVFYQLSLVASELGCTMITQASAAFWLFICLLVI